MVKLFLLLNILYPKSSLVPFGFYSKRPEKPVLSQKIAKQGTKAEIELKAEIVNPPRIYKGKFLR